MAEILVALSDVLVSEDGTSYAAQAVGAETPLGHWEAWIEFIPLDGGPPAPSPRETTQPNRVAAVYWATGLTPIYLDGALARALALDRGAPRTSGAKSRNVPPARAAAADRQPPSSVPRRAAVLDPFSVYEKGESVLRAELSALASWHLVNIIRGYQLSDQRDDVLHALPPAALIDVIVAAVRSEQEPGSRRVGRDAGDESG